MRHDNYTLYGIQDRTERQLLIGYRSLISVSSLIGDTLILVGSLRYNAIKLHKILVIFIQHIAVADLLFVTFSVVPGAVSLAANDWILGEVMCYLNYFVNDCCATAISLLMSALALSKMLIVKYPLRAFHCSGKVAKLAAGCLWVYSCVFPIAAIARDRGGVYFGYLVYNCDYKCSIDIWKLIGRLIFDGAVGLSVLTSTLVTVGSSVMLIVVAKRVAGQEALKRQGVLTVLLTVTFHTVITLPLAINYIAAAIVNHSHDWNGVLNRMYRFSWFIASFGAVFNFYIYTFNISSFREFLISRMMKISAPLMRCCVGINERYVDETEKGSLEEAEEGSLEEAEEMSVEEAEEESLV